MTNHGALTLLQGLLEEISIPGGAAASEKFASLREVDAKIREARHILASIEGLPRTFIEEMSANPDFQMQSRRVRLETLAGYIRSAIKFAESGALAPPENVIHPAPDVSKITAQMPTLKAIIDRRWKEAQMCMHAECFTAAIVMMGSILEALLLARAMLSAASASQSSKAPKNKNGQAIAVQDWNLSALIDVSVDVGWIKTDRGKFSHALRESRNVIHPWVEVAMRANFDLATCRTSWEVLLASVDDLVSSYP
jgi:hypothetical protein